MEYTDEFINSLIACAKEIIEAPKKEMVTDFSHRRNDMRLCSTDKKYHFMVFMRQSEAFNENFTIGLNFMPQTGEPTLCLFRCNGPHGEHINRLDDNHFIGYHIHIAKYEYIRSGLKSDKYAELTHEYATFDDALAFFLEKCNVVNASEYFKITKAEIDNQLELFNDGSSSDPDKKTI